MSWSLSLSIGQSFAELVALHQNSIVCDRWFLSKTSLVRGLTDLVQAHPTIKGSEIFVSTRWGQQIIKRCTESQIALFVTSGFEDWPHLRQNPSTFTNWMSFNLRPKRPPVPVPRDLIFGVTERVSVKGEILTPLAVEELEFLVSKLKLSGISQVAIGFLHSHTNPTHEKQARDFLKEKGFEVFCSHEVENTNNEVARWWKTILSTYTAPNFREYFEPLRVLEKELDLKFHFWDSSLKLRDESGGLDTSFGVHARMASHAKGQGALLHLGLEEFCLLSGEESQIWESDVGPIALRSPRVQSLGIQPTSFVEREWSGLTFSRHESGFEPGPMILGKGLRPTFLDLLFATKVLKNVEGLPISTKMKFDERLSEILFIMSKDMGPQHRTDASKILNFGLNILANRILVLSGEQKLLCSGPLASSMMPLLAKRMPEKSFELVKDPDFFEALCGLPRNEERP